MLTKYTPRLWNWARLMKAHPSNAHPALMEATSAISIALKSLFVIWANFASVDLELW